MDALISFINGFFSVLWDFGAWVINGLLQALLTILYIPYSALLAIVEGIVYSISLPAMFFNFSASWAGLPPQMIWLLNTLGFPAGLSMITSAILIRMTLNLIPAAFTRI